MSFPEMIHRGYILVIKKLDKNSRIGFLPSGTIHNYPNPILFLPEIQNIAEVKEYSIFGSGLKIDKPVNWHQDILNNREFPMQFSFSIDARTGKHGNVKVVWEVNRLQFLPLICIRYHQSKDSRHLDQFMDIIKSWKEANPYLKGVNWYSNIEVNIRIINWFFCWEILQVNQLINKNEKFRKFIEKIWLPLIELHATHSFRYGSKYSSANNHLIAEASGLFIAGSYWAFKRSSKWLKKGKRILEREIQRQHSSNGINKEEASEYIQFITDFFLISYIVGKRTGEKFSTTYELTLKNIFLYINHLMDISGNVPYYGDDDDGKVIVLDQDASNNNFQSLLISGAIIFNNASFKSKAGFFDLKNRVLFGKDGAEKFHGLSAPNVALESKFYKEEGHFILKKGGSKSETYLHIDIAPLGYLSIAAHGHADALSFILHIDGTPYIIDPGTFTYHSYPKWRQYFKGTLAHNTIRVDGLDQATYGGPSLWLDHFKVNLIEVIDLKDSIRIKGSHNGYKKIGITHTRCFTFDKENEIITIDDEITSKESTVHRYEFPLHLHPDVMLSQISQNEFRLGYTGKRNVDIRIDKMFTSTIIKGSKKPLLGWYSTSFLQKQPTSVIYSTLEISGSFKFQTVININ